jgi:hypothetical protein
VIFQETQSGSGGFKTGELSILAFLGWRIFTSVCIPRCCWRSSVLQALLTGGA